MKINIKSIPQRLDYERIYALPVGTLVRRRQELWIITWHTTPRAMSKRLQRVDDLTYLAINENASYGDFELLPPGTKIEIDI